MEEFEAQASGDERGDDLAQPVCPDMLAVILSWLNRTRSEVLSNGLL